MSKAMVIAGIIVTMCAVSGTVRAERTCAVSGEVTFSEKGTVYLEMVTEDQFNGTSKEPGKFGAMIKPSDSQIKAGRVPFSFAQVPPGKYAIRAYLDRNGNGKMDMGKFGPEEPWGVYRSVRPLLRGPNFNEISFEVKVDVSGIVVPMK